MQMKKVLAFICLLSTAAVTHAQVTFSLIGGSNETWVLDSYTNLNNGNGGWWRTNAGENAYVIFQASEKTNIQGYTITLTSNSKSDGHLPYKWTLYGGNNVGTEEEPEIVWDTIHHQAQANNIVEDFDARANINERAYTFYCNSDEPYKFYKFVITGKSRGSWGCFQISRFDLIPSSVGFSGEGYALDGTTGTKLTGDVSQTIVITPTASTKIKGYQFTTANDTQSYPDRNPKNWRLEGSNDENNWTIIDEKTNCSVMEGKNYYPYTFVLANETASYEHYRFVITGVQGGRYLQLSEVALITDLTNCTNGTYEINKEEDLIAFAEIVSGGKTSSNAYLTTDLDMTGKDYTPIGTDANRYKGSFNGQGHSVNLDIDSDEAGQGLFGHATDGARFSNLIVTGTVSGNGNCAALIGEGRGDHGYIIIRNVGLEANVTSTGAQNGAFVGNNWGGTIKLDVENSYNIGDVSGASSCLMGGWSNWTGHKFTNVYNIGEISGNDNYKFVYGDDGQATFTNCYTTCTESKADIPGLTQQISTDFIRSGELCYKLGETFRQTLGTDGHPTLDSSKPNVYEIAVSSAGYASFVPKANIKALPSGVTAYAGQKNGDWLHLEPVTGLPADAAVVVKAGEGNYYCNSTTEERSLGTDNDLAFSETDTESDGTYYCLGKKGSPAVVGFYQVQSGVTIPARKVYLIDDEVPIGEGEVKAFYFEEDDDPTGIESIQNSSQSSGAGGTKFKIQNEEPVYNLAGQRVDNSQFTIHNSQLKRGIYIVNGKKIAIK